MAPLLTAAVNEYVLTENCMKMTSSYQVRKIIIASRNVFYK